MAEGMFHVTRLDPTRPGFPTSEWLRGTVDSDDADAEALALLTDPRDTITGVYLWSTRWQQFVNKWTKRDVRRLARKEAA